MSYSWLGFAHVCAQDSSLQFSRPTVGNAQPARLSVIVRIVAKLELIQKRAREDRSPNCAPRPCISLKPTSGPCRKDSLHLRNFPIARHSPAIVGMKPGYFQNGT
jgi:hypothetical protein